MRSQVADHIEVLNKSWDNLARSRENLNRSREELHVDRPPPPRYDDIPEPQVGLVTSENLFTVCSLWLLLEFQKVLDNEELGLISK